MFSFCCIYFIFWLCKTVKNVKTSYTIIINYHQYISEQKPFKISSMLTTIIPCFSLPANPLISSLTMNHCICYISWSTNLLLYLLPFLVMAMSLPPLFWLFSHLRSWRQSTSWRAMAHRRGRMTSLVCLTLCVP